MNIEQRLPSDSYGICTIFCNSFLSGEERERVERRPDDLTVEGRVVWRILWASLEVRATQMLLDEVR